jgi:hypothetical protein
MTTSTRPFRILARATCMWATLASLTLGCASAPVARVQEPDDTQLRLVRASLRVVGKDSTWVAQGAGYELVAWTRADIVLLQPVLDEQGRVFRRVFNAEPRPVVVTARRASGRPGAMPIKAPPTPASTEGGASIPLLDVTFLPSADARAASAARRDGGLPSPDSLLHAPQGPGEQLMAVWIRELAKRMGPDGGAVAVPAWVEAAIPRLVDNDNVEDLYAVQLAAHPEALVPVSSVLEGSCPGDEAGSTGGALGGASRASRGPRDLRALREGPALSGRARCTAQALLLARFLMSREGYAVLGRMAAAQMAGGSAVEGLAGARSVSADLRQLDGEWRRWLVGRADSAGPRERE